MGHGKPKRTRGYPAAIVIVIVLAGWLASALPGLNRWSFDVLQRFLPGHTHPDPVIIVMDEHAMRDYQQEPDTWDRSLHARLLRRLTVDQPRVVVFDVFFAEAKDPAKDRLLAEAMRENGRVVLAGDRVETKPAPGTTLVPPLELFETNAAAWGTAKVRADAAFVVRAYDPGNAERESLAWAAARIAGGPVTRDPPRRLTERRWLNYYGTDRPFAHLTMSYTNAEAAAPGRFRDKAVIIGGQPETLAAGQVTDVFGTPFTRWNNRFISGVEITATAYANLMHDEWLRQLSRPAELGLLLLSGALLGLAATRWRPRPAIAFCLAMTAGWSLASIGLGVWTQTWFCWAALPAAQFPCALLISARRRAAETGPVATMRMAGSESRTIIPTATTPASVGLTVSDHILVRCIGEGAYGQVWIARNVIGLCHAVKVIYRDRFGGTEPFDRAFRGIQKFMPISRSHENFIHVLHIGRDDRRGMFYYVMEAADDQRAGQAIVPEDYAPRSLASELKQRNAIPAGEALGLMLRLTRALRHLHERQLIHRDIKPANIVFVNGQPKLADIDLVTDLSPGVDVTRIGTQGYMAPEGPGTAAADVFSLGRVLYVAITGKSPDQCPELPTRLDRYLESPHFMALIQISCKACEIEVRRRYQSAQEMQEDLEKLS